MTSPESSKCNFFTCQSINWGNWVHMLIYSGILILFVMMLIFMLMGKKRGPRLRRYR